MDAVQFMIIYAQNNNHLDVENRESPSESSNTSEDKESGNQIVFINGKYGKHSLKIMKVSQK